MRPDYPLHSSRFEITETECGKSCNARRASGTKPIASIGYGIRLSLTAGLLFGVLGVNSLFGQSYTSPNQTPTGQQAPIRQQPLQTPPKAVIQNGVPVYFQNQGDQTATPYTTTPSGTPQRGLFRSAQPQITPMTADRTTTPGFGSPYPTTPPSAASAPRVATTQTDPQRQTGSIYGLPANQPAQAPGYPPYGQPVGQPQVGQAPRVASAQPGTATPNAAPPTGSASLPVPGTVREDRQRTHVGRSAPSVQIIPFFLTPQEQQELDEFLARWEKYSETIDRYDVEFNVFFHEENDVVNQTPGRPIKIAFGYFKYVKPTRFVYHLEGQWIGEGRNAKKTKPDKDNPGIEEEKIIISDKAVFKYDFVSKTVYQVNVPQELIGRGIADSPLPLIFGAKADDMKRRFSMQIVTGENFKDSEIWLIARPLHIADQQEFREIEIRLDKKTLQAKAIKKTDINKKTYAVYQLHTTKINPIWDNLFVRWFQTDVPRGWKHEVHNWTEEDLRPTEQARPAPGPAPGTVPAAPNPGFATGMPGPGTTPVAPQREILYTPQ